MKHRLIIMFFIYLSVFIVLFTPQRIHAHKITGDELYKRDTEGYSKFRELIFFEGSYEIIKEAIEENPIPHSFPISDELQYLAVSLNKDDIRFYRLFMDNGADLYWETSEGVPVSHFLCAYLSAATLDSLFAIIPEFDINEVFLHDFSSWACILFDIEKIKLVTRLGVDINMQQPEYGMTPLMYGISTSPEAVRLLINNGANVNLATRYDVTALIFAAQQDNPEIIEILISAGADINYRDWDGKTAYDYASFKIKRSSAYELMKTVPIDNPEPEMETLQEDIPELPATMSYTAESLYDDDKFGELIMAEDSYEIVMEVIKKYPVPSSYPISDLLWNLSNSPNKDDIRYYKLLLDNGADIFADLVNSIPISAVLCNSLSAVTLDSLFSIVPGFDVNELFERYFYTWIEVLHDFDKCKLVIRLGVNVNMVESMAGITPLFMAVAKAYNPAPGVVKLLIDSGANVNHITPYKTSVLISAAQQGTSDIIEMLINAGADGSYKDFQGKTAYDHANFETKNSNAYELLDKARFGASEREFKVLPISKIKYQDAVAVVIGIRDYQDTDIPKVDYAIQDALMMKRLFVETYGLREENIIYLENATLSKFTETFGNEASQMGRLNNMIKHGETDVFIYYSGHGAPAFDTQSCYFLPADSNPAFVGLSGYSLNTFYNNLSRLSTKSLTVIIDACFSGGSAAGMLIKNSSASGGLVKNPSTVFMNSNTSTNMTKTPIILTSSMDNEISSWYPEKAHSLVTYYYIRGLQGEADTNNDKRINTTEMQAWLETNVGEVARRLFNRTQRPNINSLYDAVILEY